MRASTAGLNLTDSVFERLLQERIIVLGSEVNDEVANKITAQLLLLAAEDAEKDITLYINSPGGSVTAGMAIYDTMQLIEPDVATWAMGLAASMGQFLLSSGAPGKRYALPHARVMMHQPSAGVGGTASDIAIQAEVYAKWKREMAKLTAEQTGQTVERITEELKEAKAELELSKKKTLLKAMEDAGLLSCPLGKGWTVALDELVTASVPSPHSEKAENAEERNRVVRDYGAEEGAQQTVARLAEYVAQMEAKKEGDVELTVTRVFDAPRETVFRAWTDPEQAALWWGPQGFTTISCEMDVRPGGAYRACMRSPEGTRHCRRGVYREVVTPERLVFTFAWEDAHGDPGHEMVVTVTFADIGGKTTLTLHQAVFETVAARDDHRRGWISTIERFAEYLAAHS